jgi:hypothetical protein
MSSYKMSQSTSTAPPSCAASTWPGERVLLLLLVAVDRGTSSKRRQRTHTAAAIDRIPPNDTSSATNGHAAATEANGTGTAPSPVKKDKDEGLFECCVCARQVHYCPVPLLHSGSMLTDSDARRSPRRGTRVI